MNETMRALVLRSAELMEGVVMDAMARFCCYLHPATGRWVTLSRREFDRMAQFARGGGI